MEIFILKDLIEKGQRLFKLDYAGTSAKKESNLEICEDTQSSFSFFCPQYSCLELVLVSACLHKCVVQYLKMHC